MCGKKRDQDLVDDMSFEIYSNNWVLHTEIRSPANADKPARRVMVQFDMLGKVSY